MNININKILQKEFSKTGGARVLKFPEEKRPTLEDYIHLQNEISSQINRNDAMRERTISYVKTHKKRH